MEQREGQGQRPGTEAARAVGPNPSQARPTPAALQDEVPRKRILVGFRQPPEEAKGPDGL